MGGAGLGAGDLEEVLEEDRPVVIAVGSEEVFREEEGGSEVGFRAEVVVVSEIEAGLLVDAGVTERIEAVLEATEAEPDLEGEVGSRAAVGIEGPGVEEDMAVGVEGMLVVRLLDLPVEVWLVAVEDTGERSTVSRRADTVTELPLATAAIPVHRRATVTHKVLPQVATNAIKKVAVLAMSVAVGMS